MTVFENKTKEEIQKNGFVDNVGARNYPYQPEKHEIIGTSLLFPNIVTILSMGVCPDGTVLVTCEDKKVYRLPKSAGISNWATMVVQMMVMNPELEKFPAKLKVYYDKYLGDYTALFV